MFQSQNLILLPLDKSPWNSSTRFQCRRKTSPKQTTSCSEPAYCHWWLYTDQSRLESSRHVTFSQSRDQLSEWHPSSNRRRSRKMASSWRMRLLASWCSPQWRGRGICNASQPGYCLPEGNWATQLYPKIWKRGNGMVKIYKIRYTGASWVFELAFVCLFLFLIFYNDDFSKKWCFPNMR